MRILAVPFMSLGVADAAQVLAAALRKARS
jgi:hypothetical protein